MPLRLELTTSIRVPTEDLERLRRTLENVLKRIHVPADVLFIHIVDSHDLVRESLGIDRPSIIYEEKPVKLFIDYETLDPVLSIRRDFTNLDNDNLTLEIARELATYEVIMDPVHVERWAIPDKIEKVTPLDAMLSTAMILRLAESLLISRGYDDLIRREFIEKRRRDIVPIVEDSSTEGKVRAVQALSWDTPLSFDLAGRRDIGDELFLEARKIYNILSESGKKFLEKYDDFRAFSRNNFYFENVREYLDLEFEEE
ncbi:MAG: hypothetical protein GXO23_06355 [Crenarchaeota archaeon]|nr:hypothetical protein [Thermoproteota archaeon]